MKKLATVFICLITFFGVSACASNKNANSDFENIFTTTTKVAETSTTTVAQETTPVETTAKVEETTENDSEYLTFNHICSQDEYEKTLFGQPISEERNGEMRLGIRCTHDYYANLTIYQAQNGKYVPIFECPAVIGKNGPGKQAEGDTKTPLGSWKIGEAYGIKDDPGSLLPYTKVTEDMYWCATGSHGTKYNQLIFKSEEPDEDYSEDEHLIDYEPVYNYLIDLGYNAGNAPYAGNAIFLHVWRNEDHPTGGCVAVSEENMVTILRTLLPNTVVTIY